MQWLSARFFPTSLILSPSESPVNLAEDIRTASAQHLLKLSAVVRTLATMALNEAHRLGDPPGTQGAGLELTLRFDTAQHSGSHVQCLTCRDRDAGSNVR